MLIYTQSYLSALNTNNNRKGAESIGLHDIICHYRSHPHIGSYHWPDIKKYEKSNYQTLCVHMKISIVSRLLCNTCGIMCSKFGEQGFDDDSTYCGICGNVFCYNCLPIKSENDQKIPITQTTQQQRINVRCHLCVSCPVAIKSIKEVCY